MKFMSCDLLLLTPHPTIDFMTQGRGANEQIARNIANGR